MKTIHSNQQHLPSNQIFKAFILLLLALILFTVPGNTQLTVSTTNGNVGIKTTAIKDPLTVNGHTSFRNSGTRYLKFDNTWTGVLDPAIDFNGFLWKASGQAGFGADTIRYYQLYNYDEDKLFFDADNNIINGAHMVIQRDGSVGIGTTVPSRKLQIESSAAGGALRLTRSGSSVIMDAGSEINEASIGTRSSHPFRLFTNNVVRMQIQTNGYVGIGTTSASFPLQVNGDAYISGDLTVASDHQLKEDIHPIPHALETVRKLRPVSYRYRVDEFPELRLSDKQKMGLIAQELEKVLPDLVVPAGIAEKASGEQVSLKSVNYLDLIPVLIGAIQELEEAVAEKDRQIVAISESLERIESKIKHLDSGNGGVVKE